MRAVLAASGGLLPQAPLLKGNPLIRRGALFLSRRPQLPLDSTVFPLQSLLPPLSMSLHCISHPPSPLAVANTPLRTAKWSIGASAQQRSPASRLQPSRLAFPSKAPQT